MARTLKVYGSSPVGRCYVPESLNPHRQTRHIVTATSLSAACRLLGTPRAYTCETGNKEAIAVAMGNPGVVFWQNDRWEPRYERVPMGECVRCKALIQANLWRCETCRKEGR